MPKPESTSNGPTSAPIGDGPTRLAESKQPVLAVAQTHAAGVGFALHPFSGKDGGATMTINGARRFVAFTAVAFLLLLAAGANAGHDEVLRGVAEISGCSDPVINGTAIFMEKNSDEGVKEVTVHLQISGLPEGKHAVH